MSFWFNEKTLPILIIAISASSSVAYALCGDWRRSVYWLSAAVLNASITF